MGNNYQFNRNPKDPDPKQIAAHKDFSALLDKYREEEKGRKPRPFIRVLPWAAAFAAAATVGIFLVFRFLAPGAEDAGPYLAESRSFWDAQPLIQPPLPDLDIPFQSQRVAVKAGGEFNMQEGLKMVIPEYAFMDDRGRQISGDVDLRYRTMHDPLDFFLSGVPLHYDSAGVRYQMESAGMIEVQAFQNGSAIHLQPGKSIAIEIVSQPVFDKIGKRPSFNVYYLDEEEKSWVYRGKDDATWLGDGADPEADSRAIGENAILLERLMDRFRQQQPPPVAPSDHFTTLETDRTFELDYRDEDIDLDPQTRQILEKRNPNGIWRVDREATFNPLALSAQWEEVRIRPLDEQAFQIQFSSGEAELQLKVYPVLFGDILQEARANYQEELSRYEAERKAWEERRRQRRQAVLDSLSRERITEVDTSALSGLVRIRSRYTLDELGIWNCDRLLKVVDHLLAPPLQDETGKRYQDQAGFMIKRGQNTLYRFYAGEKALIPLTGARPEKIWVLDEQGRLALVDGFEGAWKRRMKELVLSLQEGSRLDRQSLERLLLQ